MSLSDYSSCWLAVTKIEENEFYDCKRIRLKVCAAWLDEAGGSARLPIHKRLRKLL